MQLTGRYKFEPRWRGVVLFVEEGIPGQGVRWRKATPADLKDGKVELAVSDGWRFPEERYGMLYLNERGEGRRDKEHKRMCGCFESMAP